MFIIYRLPEYTSTYIHQTMFFFESCTNPCYRLSPDRTRRKHQDNHDGSYLECLQPESSVVRRDTLELSVSESHTFYKKLDDLDTTSLDVVPQIHTPGAAPTRKIETRALNTPYELSNMGKNFLHKYEADQILDKQIFSRATTATHSSNKPSSPEITGFTVLPVSKRQSSPVQPARINKFPSYMQGAHSPHVRNNSQTSNISRITSSGRIQSIHQTRHYP